MKATDFLGVPVARRAGRRGLAFILGLVAFTGGLLTLALPGGEGAAQSPHTADLEGEAWIMSGVAYNTTQPTLHHIVLPPGGANGTLLYYNFDFANQLVLSASSSQVSCSAVGNTPGGTSHHAQCHVTLEDFRMWVGPYEIVSAGRIRVSSSSNSTVHSSSSTPSIQIEGLCVYIEQPYAGGCRTPGPGESITFDRPPISGTISYGSTEMLFSNNRQLGKGSIATGLRVNLFNADYTTATGIGSVVIDIGHAMSFAGQPLPTPTPTPTITPTRTPTKTPTASPTVFKAALPGVSRDD